ncbi:hypothetical protein [Hydrogenophaga sp. SL48]|uniref:hypothetical protein n=1 Tax=Hydrogenophaga sp. SL48 TaxID=2806347 RepID=UPI001F3E11C3|nr:hypothetical protein [Hydrogenophaga sp. SL48]UJW81844.1 hypothetical protein IM738_03745 [Hydrogenophaga sp. SL48]
MRISGHLNLFASLSLVAALAGCGGGSDDAADTGPAPTGGALANLWFADSDSYHPLDKLKPDGSFYTGTEADFGAQNPAYAANTATQSRWAIDTSAVPPEGKTLSYSFKVEGVNASESAARALTANLKINTATGLITQSCKGFPECYDNTSSADEDFLVTVTAQADGGGPLVRNFLLRVRRNN